MGYPYRVVVLFRIFPHMLKEFVAEVNKHHSTEKWVTISAKPLSSAWITTVVVIMNFKSEKHLEILLYELVANSKIIVGIEYFEVTAERADGFFIF